MQPCALEALKRKKKKSSKSKSLAATICKRCDVNILVVMPRETEPKGLSRG